MEKKEKTATITVSEKKQSVVHLHTVILISAVMLMIGFVGGVIFGATRTIPQMGAIPENSNKAQMLQALEDETVNNPQNAEAWIRLGDVYFDSDQYQKAIAAYEKSLFIAPDNPNVLTDLGVMYRRSGQSQKALELFSKAISLDPKHEISRMNKGVVLMYDLKDEQSAIQAWEELLEINPLAMFRDGQTVDELVQHYKEGHENRDDKK